MQDAIDLQARLIASTAETLNGRMWASDVLARCALIEEALRAIREEASRRLPGER